MEHRPWLRREVVGELRDRIWLYLSPANTPSEVRLIAARLLHLGASDLRRLAAAHFLASAEVDAFLASLPDLVRRLSTTSAVTEESRPDRVRGPVLWPVTVGRRAATGVQHLYVTAPPQRAFQTPENQMVAFLLATIGRLADEVPWGQENQGATATAIRRKARTADYWANARPLVTLTGTEPDARTRMRIRGSRKAHHYRFAVETYELYRELISPGSVGALQRVIESRGLATRSDGVLFELLTLFRTLDVLVDLGWRVPRLRLMRNGFRTVARRGNRTLELSYQRVPSSLRLGSTYTAALGRHGLLDTSGLRPDLVLRLRGHDSSWLLIESKTGLSRTVGESIRAALVDLLAYESAFSNVLEKVKDPIGLGIAWGADLNPVHGRIMLCTIDRLRVGLQLFLD